MGLSFLNVWLESSFSIIKQKMTKMAYKLPNLNDRHTLKPVYQAYVESSLFPNMKKSDMSVISFPCSLNPYTKTAG